MTTPCRRCVHWTRWGEEPIGTCDLGGPTPDEGCSDCHENETCDEAEERATK